MTVRTTKQADQDIADLFVQGVHRFGLHQAERYENGLFDMLRALDANPLMARVRQEFRPPVRIHPYGSHVIVYVADDDGIFIVRVLHGRQDWDRALS